MCHEPRAFANMWGSCKCSFKEGDTDLSPERYKSVEWNVEPDAVTEALSGILSARHWWFKQTCGLEAGREKKREKKRTMKQPLRRFNKQHMFHWEGYSTLDWGVPTGATSREGSRWLWQEPVKWTPRGWCIQSSWLPEPWHWQPQWATEWLPNRDFRKYLTNKYVCIKLM